MSTPTEPQFTVKKVNGGYLLTATTDHVADHYFTSENAVALKVKAILDPTKRKLSRELKLMGWNTKQVQRFKLIPGKPS